MTFKTYIESLCKKANQKLHALSCISCYFSTGQLSLTIKTFILSQLNYCPLVWMFCDRAPDNKINRLHEKALRIASRNKTFDFNTLLLQSNAVSTHKRNLQLLMIEIYKTTQNLNPSFMKEIFVQKDKTIRGSIESKVYDRLGHQHTGQNKGLSLAALNVNGLRSHHDEVSSLIKEKGIHILALNETKLVNSYPKELTNIEGYQQERKDRNAIRGGVALYIREPIQYTRRTDLPESDLEFICVEIKPPKSRPYIVIVWYRPPSDPVDSFNKLETNLSYLDREGKQIILLGDTNCDFTSIPKGQLSDNNAKHLRSIYDLFSFTQLIEEPTRVTLGTATLIDHIATTCPNNVLESGVLKISMSDHYMVYCIRKLNSSFKKDHKAIKTRNMKNFSEEAFLQDVATINWQDILGISYDVNKLVERFSTLFSLMIEKHAPLRQIRVSEKYCPWINADLKRLIRTRDRLKRSAVKHKSQVMISSYKQCRNQVNTLNVTLKRQYFSDKILQQKGNMKESWQTINQLLNKRSKSTNIYSLSDSSQTLFDKQRISDKMNKFFCSVGKTLAADIDVTPNPLLSGEFGINDGGKIFNFRAINEGDLQKAMAKMKIKKSFGNDNISGYFLKIAFAVISSSLLKIFNVSIETNTFPDAWKIARVTPIYKEGEKSEKSNYRPFLYCLSYQGYLKNLSMTSCTNI